jgi:hypothetical protein
MSKSFGGIREPLARAYPAALRSGISEPTSFSAQGFPTNPIQRFVLQLKQRAVDLL